MKNPKSKSLKTSTIIVRLPIVILLFYVAQFVLSSIFCSATGNFKQIALSPFNYTEFGFNSSAAVCSFCVCLCGFVCTIVIVTLVVQSSNIAWDYVASVYIVHIIVSFIVIRKAPSNWVWWLVIVLGIIVVILLSEVLSWCCCDMRRLRNILPQRDEHPPK
ncbi:hypothetical protein BLNAU_4604 [Blattamonas nauphoetae]|uniref:Transmembrane protein n=1 Tax=Blattamonas nauphoetae TaxID=2049346 RepID=A0ABQ9Y9F5_9EUKA|nr:hypothetical protein BLNAU_4604 [Blattamonas nauphoetae]